MAVWYVDLENGNDNWAGTSYGTRKKLIGSAVTAAASGDTIRVMASPDPVNTGLTALFTDGSRMLTLSAPCTQMIQLCDVYTQWTGSANVNVQAGSNTNFKHGTADASVQFVLTAGFTTGKIAYATTAAVNYSDYQQVSFWFKSAGATSAGSYVLKLCSDAAGETPVHTIPVPAVPVTNAWVPVILDLGSAMNSGINSVALYRDSGSGTNTLNLDIIFASKAPASVDAITLASLIGKNDGEWYMVAGIEGTALQLDIFPGQTAASATTQPYVRYFGATEIAVLWRRETIKPSPPYTNTTWQGVSAGGTWPLKKYISCGWDRTDMSTKTGQTWIDNLTSSTGTGMGNSNSGGYQIDDLCFARWNTGWSAGVNGNGTLNFPCVIGCGLGISFGGTGSHHAMSFNVPFINCCSTGVNSIDPGASIVLSKVYNCTQGIQPGWNTTVIGNVKIKGCSYGILITPDSKFTGTLEFDRCYSADITVSQHGNTNAIMAVKSANARTASGFSTLSSIRCMVLSTTANAGRAFMFIDGGYAKQEFGTALELGDRRGYASTSDSPQLSITGANDIDIRVKLSAANWNIGASQNVVGKWIGGTNQRSWVLSIANGGVLAFDWSTNGTATTGNSSAISIFASPAIAYPYTAAIPSGGVGWIRVTLDVDNGASGRVISFYTSIDGVNWTLIGTSVGGSTTTIFDSTSPLLVGQVDGGGYVAAMKIYRVQIRNGIDGTIVYDADFETATPGVGSITDAYGNLITLSGTAAITYAGKTSTSVPWAIGCLTNWQRTRQSPINIKIGEIAVKANQATSVSAWMKVLDGYAPDAYSNYYCNDSVALSITGDIDVSIDAAGSPWLPPSTSGWYYRLIGKDSDNGALREWNFRITEAGNLEFAWFDSGANYRVCTSSIVLPAAQVVSGSRQKFRVTLDVNNNSGGHDVKFYYWDNGAWTQLGTTRNAGAFTTDIRDTAAVLVVPQYQPASNQYPLPGKIYRATVKNGIDGTIVFDANFEAQTQGTESFSDGYGNTLTVKYDTMSAANIVTKNGETFFNSRNISAQIYIPANQLCGPTVEYAVHHSAASGVWEKSTMTFTPTEDAILEVWFRAYGNNLYYGNTYVDELTCSGAAFTIDTNALTRFNQYGYPNSYLVNHKSLASMF